MKFTCLLASAFIAGGLVLLPSMGRCADVPVTNLLTAPDDFGSDAWKSFNAKSTITVNATEAPNKKVEAAHLQIGLFIGQVLPTAIAGHTYVFSTWMKSATGADQNVMLGGENNPPAPDAKFASFAVTNAWQRFYMVYKCPDGANANFRFSYRAGDIYAWHPVVEDVTGKASQVPSDVPGVTSPTVAAAATAPTPAGPPQPAKPTPPPGGKNLLRASDDFASPVWNSFNLKTTITPNAATSPGKAQDAAHFVIGGFVGQVVSSAIPGHTYVFSTWLKSATDANQTVTLMGENNAPAPDNKAAQCAVTQEWQRFNIVFTCPEGGNGNFRFSIRAGDVYVWHPQVEDVTGKPSQAPTDYAIVPPVAALKPLVVKGPPAKGIIQNIACWGDSLTAGAGGTPYPAVLQANPAVGARKVVNGGVGGQTSIQIKERFLAAPEKFGDIVVLWAGRNNYFEPDTVKSDVAEMVDKVTTDRFLVLSILNMKTEGKGTGGLATILRLNQDLATRYKGHYIDIRSAIVDAYDKNSPQDVADHDNDVTPSSLRVDGIHLNTAGYKLVADKVLEYMKANSWL
ncbi:MAG TPA: SGNH/GDSL hydrolase family protein [Capsulimonadaceae bacterium]